MSKYYDAKYVWHCKNRRRSLCRDNYTYCRGTACKNYEPNCGSYHDTIEPIRKGVLKNES